MKNELCPYTLKPVEEVSASREHVVPDALGGPHALAVRASTKENNELGRTVDVALINCDLVRICSATVGVTTRSGPSELRLRGDLTRDGGPVDVTLSQDKADFRMRQPVVKNEQGDLIGVRGYGDEASEHAARIISDLARKGKTLEAGDASSMDGQVHARLRVNAEDIGRGLLKIAYLANVWVLGDEFTKSDGAAAFRSRLLPNSDPVVSQPNLATRDMDYSEYKAILPNLSDVHHLIVCYRTSNEITTIVRLFDNDLLSANFSIAQGPQSSNKEGLDLIAIHALDKSFEHRRVVGDELFDVSDP